MLTGFAGCSVGREISRDTRSWSGHPRKSKKKKQWLVLEVIAPFSHECESKCLTNINKIN